MVIIEKLTEMMEEELDDSEKYIRCAIDKREEYPAVAEVFYKLSEEEIKHMEMLHDQATAIINQYKKANGAPPEAMMTVYKILHKRLINHLTEIRAMQNVYKNPTGI